MYRFRILFIFIFTLLSSTYSFVKGQDWDSIYTSAFFEKDEILEVNLKFDITYFVQNKPREELQEAILAFHKNGEDSVNTRIRIRSRGSFRYRNCDLTPIMISRWINPEENDVYESTDNIKLVTHCFDTGNYENYILKEYLIYKIYNLISDHSFRVRLLKVNYIDTGERHLNITKYAFLIEPVYLLEKRTGTVEIEDIQPEFKDINTYNLSSLSVFQYMIGNFDWYVYDIHNLKLLKKIDSPSEKLFAIPYDFDYSGFVNAHYAERVKDDRGNIIDRTYIGPCIQEDHFRDLIMEFMNKKDDVISIIEDFQYLDNASKKNLKRYVNDFFKLERNDRLLSIFLSECLKKQIP